MCSSAKNAKHIVFTALHAGEMLNCMVKVYIFVYRPLQRMSIGMALSCLAFIIAGCVQLKMDVRNSFFTWNNVCTERFW